MSSTSALFFHIPHSQEPINFGNQAQNIYDCAPFILHINTSIELEVCTFKPNVLVKKPNMM